MATISAALIVKNEESCLASCLERLADIVDEIVIVDTGSTDQTVAIARKYTSHILSFEWNDDFAEARNYSIEHAPGDYVLVCDADHRVGPRAEGRTLLRNWVDHNGPDAAGTVEIWSAIRVGDTDHEEVVTLPRFFPRRAFHFEGAIHEQLVPSGNSARYAPTGLQYHHSGYTAPEDMARKAERNKRILLRELERSPNDEYYQFHLGKTEFCLKQYREAAEAFESALAHMDFQPGVPPRGHKGAEIPARALTDLLCSLAYSLVNTGRTERALQLLEEHAAMGHGALGWADFHHALGYVYLIVGDVARARAAYEASLQLGAQAEIVRGTGSHGSFYHLGLLAEARQDLPAAMTNYVHSLQLCPDYSVTLSRCVDFAVEYRTAWPPELWEACDHDAFIGKCAEKLQACVLGGDAETAKLMLTLAGMASPELLEACTASLKSLQ